MRIITIINLTLYNKYLIILFLIVINYIAPGKAWERGRVNPETFQRDPAGNQSCPVKSGDQPEASLTRTGVTRP